MGLVKEGDDYVILTDIQGAEDHLGDMDFKVAGTADGITALQMDIKITGVTREIMENALAQAARAREFILDKMLEATPESRTELAAHAPRITSIKIDPEQIGLVIGKGGETIRCSRPTTRCRSTSRRTARSSSTRPRARRPRPRSRRSRALTKEPEVGDEYHNGQGRQDDRTSARSSS